MFILYHVQKILTYALQHSTPCADRIFAKQNNKIIACSLQIYKQNAWEGGTGKKATKIKQKPI